MTASHLSALILARRQRAGVIILATPTRTSLLQPVAGLDITSPVPLTDMELGTLLTRLLPDILAGVEQARAALGDRRLSLAEAAALATTVMGVVSAAVVSGAPLVQGQSARVLVLLVFGALFDQIIVPMLPVWSRPFAPVIKAGVVRGLEGLYRAVIRQGGR